MVAERCVLVCYPASRQNSKVEIIIQADSTNSRSAGRGKYSVVGIMESEDMRQVGSESWLCEQSEGQAVFSKSEGTELGMNAGWPFMRVSGWYSRV